MKNLPHVDVAIVGDAGRVLHALIAAWKADPAIPDTQALTAWWRQIDAWRAKDSLKETEQFLRTAPIKEAREKREGKEVVHEQRITLQVNLARMASLIESSRRTSRRCT